MIDREMRERVLSKLNEGKVAHVVCRAQSSGCDGAPMASDVCGPSYAAWVDICVEVNDVSFGEVCAVAFCVDYSDSSTQGATYGCMDCADFADGRLQSLKDMLRRGAVLDVSQSRYSSRDMFADGSPDVDRAQHTVLRNARLVSEERSMAIDDVAYERRLWFTADEPEEMSLN